MWAQAKDLIGETLDGRYHLIRLLGEGGMGAVFEGRNLRIDKRVAIKVLSPHLASDERQQKRFLREARAANRIRCRHVVEILDFGEDPTAFFVMEFLEGQDLYRLMRKAGSLPWPRSRAIVLQVTKALAAAHEEGIIHRDVKPSNIFIEHCEDGSDFVKVVDFGIAKSTQSSPETRGVTRTHEVLGTVSYMAPEQALGHPVDPRTDVYALGVVLFELLAGQPPFNGNSDYEIIDQHVRKPPPPLREIAPNVALEAELVVTRALAKDPNQRFRNMVEFAEAIESIPFMLPMAGVGSPARGPLTTRFGAATPISRHGVDSSKPLDPPTAPRQRVQDEGDNDEPTVQTGRLRSRGRSLWVPAGIIASLMAGTVAAALLVQASRESDPVRIAESTADIVRSATHVPPATSPSHPVASAADPDLPARDPAAAADASAHAPAQPSADAPLSPANAPANPPANAPANPDVEPPADARPSPANPESKPSAPTKRTSPTHRPTAPQGRQPLVRPTGPALPSVEQGPPNDRATLNRLVKGCELTSAVVVTFQVMPHGKASLVRSESGCLRSRVGSAQFSSREKPEARSFECTSDGCR